MQKIVGSQERLDDFKAALYACPYHADDGIYSDHSYLATWEIPAEPP